MLAVSQSSSRIQNATAANRAPRVAKEAGCQETCEVQDHVSVSSQAARKPSAGRGWAQQALRTAGLGLAMLGTTGIAMASTVSQAAPQVSAKDRAAVKAQVPATDSPLGKELIVQMDRVVRYDPAQLHSAAAGEPVKGVDWNVDNPKTPEERTRLEETFAANPQLNQANLVMLQEIPWQAAHDLADKTGMHLLWGPEFLELNPREGAGEAGITGNAILSRFEISSPEMVRFTKQSDWYTEEKKDSPLPEKGIRLIGNKVLGAGIPNHEVRAPLPYGGRMALLADIDVPGQGQVKVADIHLENHAKPVVRREQMQNVLDKLVSVNEPVIFGGDFNTINKDGRQQTIGRELLGQVDTKAKVVETAGGLGLRAVPFAGWGKDGYDVFKFVKAHQDPTSRMSTERGLFTEIHDQMGVKPANERDTVGYKHTWTTPHPRMVGNGILDWVFYKDASGGSQVTNSQVLSQIVKDSGQNGSEPISDHFPLAFTVAQNR